MQDPVEAREPPRAGLLDEMEKGSGLGLQTGHGGFQCTVQASHDPAAQMGVDGPATDGDTGRHPTALSSAAKHHISINTHQAG